MRNRIKIAYNYQTHIEVIGFAILMLLIIFSGIADASVGIELKDKVSLLKSKVLLKDIADVSSEEENESLISKIESIEIGNAPLIGQYNNIKLDYVKLRLKQSGIDMSDIIFGDNDSVFVDRKTKILDGQVILDKAIEFVKANIAWQEDEVIIEPVKQPADLEILDRDYSIEMVPNPAMDFDGQINLTAEISLGDGSQKKSPVSLNIRRFAEVLITNKRVDRGQQFTPDDFILQKREITNLGSNFFTDPDALIDKHAKSIILANQIITKNMVERPFLVKRQNIVTIVYEIPEMVVAAKGIARKDGYEGDIIKVSNLDSKKDIQAQVVSDSLVRIVR